MAPSSRSGPWRTLQRDAPRCSVKQAGRQPPGEGRLGDTSARDSAEARRASAMTNARLRGPCVVDAGGLPCVCVRGDTVVSRMSTANIRDPKTFRRWGK